MVKIKFCKQLLMKIPNWKKFQLLLLKPQEFTIQLKNLKMKSKKKWTK